MSHDYEDILHLPHHRSKHRSHMSMHDRAAQFSPFAALTGFESAITETGRLTDHRLELEEYGKSVLDSKLAQLIEQVKQKPYVSILFFQPDERKAGGAYTEVTGQIRKIDLYRQVIIMMDGMEIPTGEIVSIESDGFPGE